jgi:hypothetical protein
MPRKVVIAAIQMDATPAPTVDRLNRAERLVVQAAKAGAQLVVLPEVFNTGYAYTPQNFLLTEAPGGLTMTWMKRIASRFNIHLAGSLLLWDTKDIYNSLLLSAPDGKIWRYDKQFPWAWERGYFRPGKRGNSVARTDLGALGMMICWDVAHPNLWRGYAGLIDLLVVCSCPPDVSNPTLRLANGSSFTFDDLGPFFTSIKGDAGQVFGEMINQQTAWIGVPTVNSMGCGTFSSHLPNSLATYLALLPFAPWQVKQLPYARQVQMTCPMVTGTKIVGANGQVIAELTQAQGETCTLAEARLADKPVHPPGAQPPAPIHWFSYFTGDVVLPRLVRGLYRRGIQARI